MIESRNNMVSKKLTYVLELQKTLVMENSYRFRSLFLAIFAKQSCSKMSLLVFEVQVEVQVEIPRPPARLRMVID